MATLERKKKIEMMSDEAFSLLGPLMGNSVVLLSMFYEQWMTGEHYPLWTYFATFIVTALNLIYCSFGVLVLLRKLQPTASGSPHEVSDSSKVLEEKYEGLEQAYKELDAKYNDAVKENVDLKAKYNEEIRRSREELEESKAEHELWELDRRSFLLAVEVGTKRLQKWRADYEELVESKDGVAFDSMEETRKLVTRAKRILAVVNNLCEWTVESSHEFLEKANQWCSDGLEMEKAANLIATYAKTLKQDLEKQKEKYKEHSEMWKKDRGAWELTKEILEQEKERLRSDWEQDRRSLLAVSLELRDQGLEKLKDEQEKDRAIWEEEKRKVVTEANEALMREKLKYDEDRQVWNQERTALVEEVWRANKSAKTYQGLLHDLDQLYRKNDLTEENPE